MGSQYNELIRFLIQEPRLWNVGPKQTLELCRLWKPTASRASAWARQSEGTAWQGSPPHRAAGQHSAGHAKARHGVCAFGFKRRNAQHP
jgi:hypothetical protein